MKKIAPPQKIFFVHDEVTAEYCPELATKWHKENDLFVYKYISSTCAPHRDTKVGKTVPMSLEQISKLIRNYSLKVL